MFSITVLTIVFVFLLPNTAHALVTNTFSCKTGTASNQCVVGITDCAGGYSSDAAKCATVANPNGLTCLAASFPCTQTVVTKYRCDPVQKTCVPDPNGTYNSWQLCSNTCGATLPTPTPTGTGGTDLTKCNSGSPGIQTAIGCIPVFDQTTFLSAILKWAVGIGGGIAFLLTIYAGFMIMTSSGNPERLKAGQELLTSALSGLILLILSIFVLKFIGIDILGLGAFGFGATPTP